MRRMYGPDQHSPGTEIRGRSNPYLGSFNGSFRDECLNVHWFLSLDDARTKIEPWRRDDNAYRPHQSLDGLSPEMYFDAYSSSRADSLLLTG